jgi:hypothetical protein
MDYDGGGVVAGVAGSEMLRQLMQRGGGGDPSGPWLLAFIGPLFLAALGIAIGVISAYFARKHKATSHRPKVS